MRSTTAKSFLLQTEGMPQSADLHISIEGMHCGGCVTRVTHALKKVAGVDVRNVDVGSASVTYNPGEASKEEILEAVNRIGFTASVSPDEWLS